MTLLDQISDALGASGALGDLSTTLGASSGDTESLVSAGLPAILGGLGAQTGGDGIGAIMGLLGADDGGFVDNLGSFFGQGDKTGLASKLVGSLFGGQRSAIESSVADTAGGTISMVSRFLPMLAPAVMGLLAKVTAADDDLDADALTQQLGALSTSGPLASIFENNTDDDRSGFVDGIAAMRDAGGLGALIPAASSVAPIAAAGAGATAAGAGAATLVGATGDDDEHRTGLAWLPALLFPLLLLIAGLVLWQCTSINDAEPVAAHSDDDGAEEAADEPQATPEPTAVPEPTAAPAPTATPEPEPTPEPVPPAAPVVTIADLASGDPRLSTLLDLSAQFGLDGALADGDAGPFTIFAPTNDAFTAFGPTLGGYQGDQLEQTVQFHVVPGIVQGFQLIPGATFETLAGETITIAGDGTLSGDVQVIDRDLVADNGRVHIVDSVLVPGSIRGSIAAQNVNQAFQLNPIQFALNSADILPESTPILDEAIVTLTSLPAGSRFEVQGHTDSQGPADANQVLSESRATSVVAYLVAGGVDPDMLVPVGYGETDLAVDPEESPEDFATNRRIEFEVLS